MNHWRDISYRNNVNRGHNDIFNVSLYAKNLSPEKQRHETTTRTNSRCSTSYQYRLGREKETADNWNPYEIKIKDRLSNKHIRNQSMFSNRINYSKPVASKNKKSDIFDHANRLNKSSEIINFNKRVFDEVPDYTNVIKKCHDSMALNDTLNEIVNQRLYEKIKNRKRLTEKASKSLEHSRAALLGSRENSNLNTLEKSGSGFLDRFIDHVKIRAREKSERKENLIKTNLNKFINVERPEKIDYFNNYVDNIPNSPSLSPVLTKSNKINSPASSKKALIYLSDDDEIKHDFQAGLRKQVEAKVKEREDAKRQKMSNERYYSQMAMKKFFEEKRDKEKKVQAATQSLIFTNLQIMNDKAKQKKADREKEYTEVKWRNKLINEKIRDDIMQGVEIQSKIRENLKYALNKQIEEKSKSKAEGYAKYVSNFNNSQGLNFHNDSLFLSITARKKCDLTKYLK